MKLGNAIETTGYCWAQTATKHIRCILERQGNKWRLWAWSSQMDGPPVCQRIP